jgi:hypothetical protein
MNRKQMMVSGWLLMMPLLLWSENLIQNGSFSAEAVSCGSSIHLLGSNEGQWAYVSGVWGWKQASIQTQCFMTVSGSSYSQKGKAEKGFVQAFEDNKTHVGSCSLRFIYYIKNARTTQQKGNYLRASVYGAERERFPVKVNLHEPLAENSHFKRLATQDLTDFGSKNAWTPFSMDVDLGPGYECIVVEFSGSGVSGEVGGDDVAFFSSNGRKPPVSVIPKLVPTFSKKDMQAAFRPLYGGSVVVIGDAPASSAKLVQPTRTTVIASKVDPAPRKPVQKQIAVAQPAPAPRPVFEPIRPPVENLVLNGDFSSTSLALPTALGNTTDELSGRWLRSATAPWEIVPYGGNLGPYVRATSTGDPARLLYVAKDDKRSKGSYALRFDYVKESAQDHLSVKVFVSDRDITVGTTGGNFRMNNTSLFSDMVDLPVSKGWKTYHVPVELGAGYNYVYVLFAGNNSGNTGLDNVTLSPVRP